MATSTWGQGGGETAPTLCVTGAHHPCYRHCRRRVRRPGGGVQFHRIATSLFVKQNEEVLPVHTTHTETDMVRSPGPQRRAGGENQAAGNEGNLARGTSNGWGHVGTI